MNAPLVFLHGWGQSKKIWYQQAQHFPGATFLNLPGHGGEPESPDWIKALASQLPDTPAILAGWSLGGMLAMELALHVPKKVAGLVLIATTPAFCMQPGWDCACAPDTWNTFESGIATRLPSTMNRFFRLMLQGDALSRAACSELARQAVDKTAPPSLRSLQRGLQYLADIDIRAQLKDITHPALVLHGSHDAIVPVQAGGYLADKLGNSQWQCFDGCGHAPFLTRSKEFNETVRVWCQQI